MTKLMQALDENPGQAYEFEAELPSGNTVTGTIGPMIGDKCCIEVHFSRSPPSDEDKRLAREVTDSLMGCPAEAEFDANKLGGLANARKAARRKMGGGIG